MTNKSEVRLKVYHSFTKIKFHFYFRFKSNVIQVKMFNKNTHTTVTICNLALPLELTQYKQTDELHTDLLKLSKIDYFQFKIFQISKCLQIFLKIFTKSGRHIKWNLSFLSTNPFFSNLQCTAPISTIYWYTKPSDLLLQKYSKRSASSTGQKQMVHSNDPLI